MCRSARRWKKHDLETDATCLLRERVLSSCGFFMIGVMYALLRVECTQPLAIEMLISLNTYGEMSAEQSFMSHVGHGLNQIVSLAHQ